MTGFSADWLALREAADHASVNASLRFAVRQHFDGRETLRVLDLGSGTGSNMRGLAPWLPATRQHWTLVDYDAALLGHAAAAPPSPPGVALDVVTECRDLSGGRLDGLLETADLVTASALFDLVSPAVIEMMVTQIAAQRCPFYTVLTYDGIASWLPEHPDDAVMRTLFNAHQQTDKGFGPAAGPEATDVLERAFVQAGYRVQRGASPWVVTSNRAALRQAVDRGWAGAVRETGHLEADQAGAWIAHRDAAPDAVTIVGHEDLLAVPGGT